MTAERWAQFSLAAQLTNIESELARAESLQAKQDPEHARACLFRALDLAQLSAFGSAPAPRRKELRRLYELVADLTQDTREYQNSISQVRQLLQPFASILAREREE